MECEYSDLQKASTNFMRNVAKNTVMEYIREVKEFKHEEYKEETMPEKVWYDKDPMDEDYISVIYNRLIIDVPKEIYLKCFEKLDKEEMSLLHGYYYLGMSDRKLGEIYCMARTTAQSKRYAAEKKLRRYIVEECPIV